MNKIVINLPFRRCATRRRLRRCRRRLLGRTAKLLDGRQPGVHLHAAAAALAALVVADVLMMLRGAAVARIRAVAAVRAAAAAAARRVLMRRMRVLMVQSMRGRFAGGAANGAAGRQLTVGVADAAAARRAARHGGVACVTVREWSIRDWTRMRRKNIGWSRTITHQTRNSRPNSSSTGSSTAPQCGPIFASQHHRHDVLDRCLRLLRPPPFRHPEHPHCTSLAIVPVLRRTPSSLTSRCASTSPSSSCSPTPAAATCPSRR